MAPEGTTEDFRDGGRAPTQFQGLKHRAPGERDQDLLLVCDQNVDDVKMDELHVARSTFRRLAAKKLQVADSSFRACLFEDCYFHRAHFTNVAFTGSMFTDCNLDEATIVACSFEYVRFRRTLIDRNVMLQNLPNNPNQKRDLLRELRMNARTLGRDDDARLYLLEELQATKAYLRQKATGKVKFQAHYTWTDHIGASIELVWWHIQNVAWGHGLKLQRLLFTTVVIVLVCAFIIQYGGATWLNETSGDSTTFWNALYLSATSLVGAPTGSMSPSGAWSQFLATLQTGSGLVLFGLFVTTLYRRFAK